MNGYRARGLLVFLLLVSFALVGCDTFLGVPMEDQEYKAPSFSLSTPLRVVEAGDTIRVQADVSGGYDFVIGENQTWYNIITGDDAYQTGWLYADFIMTISPGPAPERHGLHCGIHFGPDYDDLTTHMYELPVDIFPTLNDAYQLAITDASVAEPGEVIDTLWSIDEDAPYLRYNMGELYGTVQLVTWTDSDSYDLYVNDVRTTDWGVTWVTIPYQLLTAFDWSSMSEEQLTKRLIQYLGLPPDTEKDRMVVLNVTPADLRRPTMDPEIDDSSALLEWSAAADSAYQAWFEGNEDYTADGYPWTRLGYTYDWGRLDSKVGASEYIIREGAVVEVQAIFSTAEFFSEYPYYYGWYWWGEPGIRID